MLMWFPYQFIYFFFILLKILTKKCFCLYIYIYILLLCWEPQVSIYTYTDARAVIWVGKVSWLWVGPHPGEWDREASKANAHPQGPERPSLSLFFPLEGSCTRVCVCVCVRAPRGGWGERPPSFEVREPHLKSTQRECVSWGACFHARHTTHTLVPCIFLFLAFCYIYTTLAFTYILYYFVASIMAAQGHTVQL